MDNLNDIYITGDTSKMTTIEEDHALAIKMNLSLNRLPFDLAIIDAQETLNYWAMSEAEAHQSYLDETERKSN